MSDVTAQPKTTSARRRPGRQNARSGGQKAYASENDASIADVAYGPRYHGTPSTPDKAPAASRSPAPAAANSISANAAAKQRNKGKPKPKNAPTSPEFGHPGHQTTPDRPTSIKPGTTTAYAGATFHASPAPSALPMPSFLFKTSNESPASKQPRNIAQEPSPPATDTDIPTPQRPSSVPKPQESPLDFMFRAHREEREHQRRGSSVDQRPYVLGTSSPPSLSPFETSNSVRATSMPQARPGMSRSSSGIDSAELDGTPGRPIGPAFSTPYQDRIKAARANAARANAGRANPNQTPPRYPQQDTSQDPTEALKKFLFSGAASPGSNSHPAGGMAASTPSHLTDQTAAPSSAQIDGSGQERTQNLQAMENDLRRILKMDIETSSSNPERRVFSQ